MGKSLHDGYGFESMRSERSILEGIEGVKQLNRERHYDLSRHVEGSSMRGVAELLYRVMS